ncbi:two-component SAPR family response regulator [Paenibacillus endophyticus]|uniref:Two-component SAPR family response regulator n=1 Tax=Paenibacillus endophyticus TaxID=1294268 RepID=A0A7W5CBG6_9BACL|nr:two-component SAPR family response regulator [Paenibacillus endophyticus]
MKVLLIDDERLALVQLERMLNQAAELTAIDTFQNPLHAVEQAEALQPDVVFLDIHMPEISGLQAAELIQQACPDADIVFVTAHDEYAINAFELNAVDYVLKPLQKSRIQKTVERLISRRAGRIKSFQDIDQPQMIYCFKTLRFQSQGLTPEIPKWRTSKAQELFLYLLHHRKQLVHKSTLLELFFPEMELKRAMTQLYTAIYQIRQCLQKMGMELAIQNSSIQEGYILDMGQVVLDTEKWERELAKQDDLAGQNKDKLLQLLDDYEGDYMQDYGYIWAENERERLRQLWLSRARGLAQSFLQHKESRIIALNLFERIQAADPYNEAEGLIVMKLYDELGFYDKVSAHYERLILTMENELGLPVAEPVSAWYKQWQSQRMGKEHIG